MEAPDKIKIGKYNLTSDGDVVFGWVTNDPDCEAMQHDIEYIRADAFIKKACDFFEENIEEEDCKIGSSEWTELRAEYKSLDSFIRAFVEYIKRE